MRQLYYRRADMFRWPQATNCGPRRGSPRPRPEVLWQEGGGTLRPKKSSLTCIETLPYVELTLVEADRSDLEPNTPLSMITHAREWHSQNPTISPKQDGLWARKDMLNDTRWLRSSEISR